MIGNERLLTNGWQILKFSECIKQLNTGLNPRNHFSLGHGSLKYITAKNLTQFGTIDFSKCDFIDEQAKRIIHRRSDIQVGDILFSSRAPIGHCHLICEKPDDYDIGESIFSIRVNRKIILPDYLCLYMASDYFVRMASLHTTGSIIQEIRISDLMDTDVILPPMNEQRRIAECFKKIDRKIALNNKINDNLAQQAQLLFDFMFQDISGSKHIGDFIVPQRGTALLSKDAIPGDIPVVAGGLVPSTYHNAANTVAPVITISSSGANAGFVNLWGVPINLALFAVYMAGTMLGPVWGAASQLVYLLLAAVGVPVMAGMQGGPAVLLGKTGGYAIGYLLAALIAGAFAAKLPRKFGWLALGCVVGCAACYVLGTIWFMVLTGLDLPTSLTYCVIPYLPGDVIKIALASLLTIQLDKRMPKI